MQPVEILSGFFTAISRDARINTKHISIYCALLQLFHLQGDVDPICTGSREVMELAKISGLATYHRCIRDLHDFGYLRYQPSYHHHRRKNRMYLISSQTKSK